MISPKSVRYNLYITERKYEAAHEIAPFGLLQLELRVTHELSLT